MRLVGFGVVEEREREREREREGRDNVISKVV